MRESLIVKGNFLFYNKQVEWTTDVFFGNHITVYSLEFAAVITNQYKMSAAVFVFIKGINNTEINNKMQ